MRSVVPALPSRLRSLTPERLRDDVRLRALAVGSGVIPPRTMHSAEDARVLLEAAKGAKRVVEIGVYEGSSALALCAILGPDAELHLVDPFGSHPDALPTGWGATEWATRRVVSRALRRRGSDRAERSLAYALSHEVATSWSGEVDVVFIDGDHSEAGCELDWSCWHPFVPPAAAWCSTTRAPTGPVGVGCRGRRRSWHAISARMIPRRGGRSRLRLTAPWSCGEWPERPASMHEERGLHALFLVVRERAEQRVAAGVEVERQGSGGLSARCSEVSRPAQVLRPVRPHAGCVRPGRG